MLPELFQPGNFRPFISSLTAYCFKQEGHRQLSNCCFKSFSASIGTYNDSHQHPGASFLQPKGRWHFEHCFSNRLFLEEQPISHNETGIEEYEAWSP
jgi:hypothetical protein